MIHHLQMWQLVPKAGIARKAWLSCSRLGLCSCQAWWGSWVPVSLPSTGGRVLLECSGHSPGLQLKAHLEITIINQVQTLEAVDKLKTG